MSQDFLSVEVYKFVYTKKVIFKKGVCFKNGDIVKIATFGSGGGGGFSPATWFQISIKTKDKKGELEFKEIDRSEEGTPIKDFVVENKESLFKFLEKV